MKLEWSAFAIDDRSTIFDYIESENPRAAAALDERVEMQAGRLAHFPEIGRPGRVEGTRELVIGNTPYVAVYRTPGTRYAFCAYCTEHESGPMTCQTRKTADGISGEGCGPVA